jgi:hypothetical protein
MWQRKVCQHTVPTWLHAGEGQLGDSLNALASHGARRAMRCTARCLEPCSLAQQGGQCGSVASTQSSAVRGDTMGS